MPSQVGNDIFNLFVHKLCLNRFALNIPMLRRFLLLFAAFLFRRFDKQLLAYAVPVVFNKHLIFAGQ